jgi:hypothetical protein
MTQFPKVGLSESEERNIMLTTTERGLTMDGLSSEDQQACREAHNAFLKKYTLESWPLTVTLQELEPGPSAPQSYCLRVKCGAPGEAEAGEALTSSPGLNLTQRLAHTLEGSYERMKLLRAERPK